MTKLEYGKCIKLMEEAIREAKQANEEYEKSNYSDYEVWQIKADQHYGYAEGINQVLVTLGFRHDRMNELSNLL